MTETYPNKTEAAIADLVAGRWPGETDAEWAYRVRGLVAMAKRDVPDLFVLLCDHGAVLCARCDFIPPSWKPNL